MCGSIVGEAIFEFYAERGAMWQALLDYGRRGYWLFAHNLEYDLPVVAGDDLWSGQLLFKKDGLLSARFPVGLRNVRFLDSTNLFPHQTVAELGAMVGLPKLPEPVNWRVLHGGWTGWGDFSREQQAAIRKYNLRDSQIVFRAVSLLQDEVLALGGVLKQTIAGCALDLYRRRYHKWPWPVPGEETNRLAREAFYGGRVENFAMGKVDGVNLYDVNSLYPYVQRVTRFPHPSHLRLELNPAKNSECLNWQGVIAARVVVPDSFTPPLPTRARERLFFATGELSGLWPLSEFRAARERGAQVLEIDFVLGAPVTFSPFADYVDRLYERRHTLQQEGDGRQMIVKLLLNSLYGRFGLNLNSALMIWRQLPPDPDWEQLRGALVIPYQGRAICFMPVETRVQPAYVNVLFAAEIAAQARLHLLSGLESQAERAVYCDTDSILTRGELEVGDGLGGWRQQMQAGTADLLGLKEYLLHNRVMGDRAVSKGVPQSLAAEYLRTGSARFERALKIREAIARNDYPAVWVETVRERGDAILKRRPLDVDYERRSGWTATVPWSAQELPELVAGTKRWRLARGQGRGRARPAATLSS